MKSQKNKFPLEPKVNWWRLPEEVDQLSKTVTAIGLNQGPVGPAGAQGTQGIQGPPGPVGPAGLNWQGAWTSGTSYVEDDAVAYDGASWFCILATSGTSNPSVDTAHWALLASQGAQGIQGVQGPQGSQGPAGVVSPKTNGLVYGSNSIYSEQILLNNDINVVWDGSVSSFFRLPDTTTVGKEVIVDVMGNNCRFYGFNGGLAFETAVNSSTSQIIAKFNDLIKFISLGNNYWIVEYLSRTAPANILTTSQQVTANLTTTNFSGIKYVRLFASSAGRSVKWNEPIMMGMDLYVKNPSLYPVAFYALGLNMSDSGDGYIYINPGEYYYFVKEDSGTNTLTPFKLTNGVSRMFSVNTTTTTAPTLAQMNTNYSNNVFFPIGCKIQFSAITAGPLVYTKTTSNTWTTEAVTILT